MTYDVWGPCSNWRDGPTWCVREEVGTKMLEAPPPISWSDDRVISWSDDPRHFLIRWLSSSIRELFFRTMSMVWTRWWVINTSNREARPWDFFFSNYLINNQLSRVSRSIIYSGKWELVSVGKKKKKKKTPTPLLQQEIQMYVCMYYNNNIIP